MPQQHSPTTRKVPAKKRSRPPQDAVSLLTADHKEVKALFRQYEVLRSQHGRPLDRQLVAERVCGLLTVHATIEEELLYPIARSVLDSERVSLVEEAEVEHATMRDLIGQIEASCAEDELFDAKVCVLGEYVEHHVREEEKELFPQLKKLDLDLISMGEELKTRKEELMEASGLEPAPRGRRPPAEHGMPAAPR